MGFLCRFKVLSGFSLSIPFCHGLDSVLLGRALVVCTSSGTWCPVRSLLFFLRAGGVRDHMLVTSRLSRLFYCAVGSSRSGLHRFHCAHDSRFRTLGFHAARAFCAYQVLSHLRVSLCRALDAMP